MEITKCDLCKREIKNYKDKIYIIAPNSMLGIQVSFHIKCAKPILDFLKKHSFIEKKSK